MHVFWIIIAAVMVLIVLFFSLWILSQKGGIFFKTAEDCAVKGGNCFSARCGTGDAANNPTILSLGCSINGEYKSSNYCCS